MTNNKELFDEIKGYINQQNTMMIEGELTTHPALTNMQDEEGNTLLLYAIQHNKNEQIISRLIDLTQDVTIQNKANKNALDLARNQQISKIVEQLEKKLASTQIKQAVTELKTDTFLQILRENKLITTDPSIHLDINLILQKKYLAEQITKKMGYGSVPREKINARQEIYTKWNQAVSVQQRDPRLLAMKLFNQSNQSTAISTSLIMTIKAFDPNDTTYSADDEYGSISLLLALVHQDYIFANMLISKGANIHSKTHTGFTALMAASLGGKESKVLATRFSTITKYVSATMNTDNYKGMMNHITTLLTAVETKNDPETIRTNITILVEYVSNNDSRYVMINRLLQQLNHEIKRVPNKAPNDEILTNLHAFLTAIIEDRSSLETHLTNLGLCVEQQDAARIMVQDLIKQGADIQARNQEETTILMCTARARNPYTMRIVLDNNPDLNAQDNRGNTALILCGEDYTCVKMLGEEGAMLDKQNHNGDTALHIAANAISEQSARYLIKKGADIGKKNKKGLTPLHIAHNNAHRETVKVILQQGHKLQLLDSPLRYWPAIIYKKIMHRFSKDLVINHEKASNRSSQDLTTTPEKTAELTERSPRNKNSSTPIPK